MQAQPSVSAVTSKIPVKMKGKWCELGALGNQSLEQ